jgi:hypothetical protein
MRREVDWVNLGNMRLIRAAKAIVRLALLMFQRSATKKRWGSRTSDEAINGYLSQVDGPNSYFLVDFFGAIQSKSFLEIGSNCGNRLVPLALKFPNTHFVGVDINGDAILVGQEYLREHAIPNVTLLQFDITSEEFYEFLINHNFDIVFSWATLIYLHPIDLVRFLKSMLIATQRFVFIEQMYSRKNRFFPRSLPARNFLQWKHDFVGIIEDELNSDQTLAFDSSPVPNHIWSPAGGGAVLISGEIVTPNLRSF